MHLGFADFDFWEFRSGRFKNGIVGLAGIAGGRPYATTAPALSVNSL